jgi:hypothetical protein
MRRPEVPKWIRKQCEGRKLILGFLRRSSANRAAFLGRWEAFLENQFSKKVVHTAPSKANFENFGLGSF